MRVLLQNTETKLYFAGPNEWTADSAKAVDFQRIAQASQVYLNQNLAYAEIVLAPDVPDDPQESVEAESKLSQGAE